MVPIAHHLLHGNACQRKLTMFSQDIQPCKHQWKCQCHTAAQPGSEQFEMNKGGWTCAGPTHQLINAAVESSRPDGFCFDAGGLDPHCAYVSRFHIRKPRFNGVNSCLIAQHIVRCN
ncbi:hypothetical protein VFPPC_16087 [Pochonia chlamydosporia 170]|uniref:Uncharacterized protein n=1 Tax=Pochonia chlamydosporia 170 TaxID=1380566 RepID=A0A179FPM8_METCM|nr:hypothetical protein VFPPC_16087 [Pochonia chlamydosporia 170]OAQ66959.1 hypothetical protein VFPPC_16087 [Pochonia chlamydosporia 170]